MKSQTNIETAFRKAEKGLTIQPSAQAWQKLDRRMGNSRPKNGAIVSMYKWMAVAASLLILVVSMLFMSGPNDLAFDYMPTIVEEIGNETDCNPYCLLLENRGELPSYYAAPIISEWN